MPTLAIVLSFFMTIHPSSTFKCDEDILTATIRNNQNGDFMITDDLEDIDKGAFVVLEWKGVSLMLPVSFKVGDIAFTDKKWLWSYQEGDNGLRMDSPRLAQILPNGEIVEHECTAFIESA